MWDRLEVVRTVSVPARREPHELDAAKKWEFSGTSIDGTNGARPLELQQYCSGPLPPPEMLGRYEEMLPGTTERMLSVAERSATGPIDTADKLADAEVKLTEAHVKAEKRGNDRAFTLTLIALVASIVFFVLGNEIAGVTFISLPMVLLIRSFIRGF